MPNIMNDSSYDSIVNSFYLAFYGRPADPAGLAFWSTQLRANDGNLDAITAAFARSDEAQARFGGDTLGERISDIYHQLFNRVPDSDGLAFWTQAIEQGHATLADVSLSILHGAQGSDATLSAMRQKAADAFTAAVEASGGAYDGYAAIDAARILVRAVTADATQADIDAIVKAAVSFADTATRTPKVVDAIATGTTLQALFDTTRGMGDPVALAQALSDTAKAAAGDPVTLDSLLRGGGMDKVLRVMPASATLKDVVAALAKGGLPAAVEVVYPSAPDDAPAPVLHLAFLGVEQGSGDTHVDNVTKLAQAKVEFSYSGRKLAGGEHFEYSLDGSNWSGAGVQTLKVGNTNVVSIAAVDLAGHAPGLQSLDDEAIADRLTTVHLRAVDAAGKPTGAAASQVIVYDQYAAAPMLAIKVDPVNVHFAPGLHHVRDAGAIVAGAIEAGGRIEYQDDVGSADSNAEPGWSLTPPTFVEGENTLRVRQVDAAGNVSKTTTLTFTLDTKAPAQPTLALKEDTGADAHDGITSNPKVLIDGLDSLSSTGWEYSTDGATWEFGGVNDGTGKAVFDAAVLGEGHITLQVRQIDAAGNASGAQTLEMTYDKGAFTPVAATLASIGFDLRGATNTATLDAGDATVTGLHNAATFVLSDYGSGSAQPTSVDYTAAPQFGVDDGVLTFSQPLQAGLYQMSWTDDTFSTDTGYLAAKSVFFGGGVDGLFHFEGVKLRDYIFQVKSGGVFGSSDNEGYVVASTLSSAPYLVTGGGHDVVVKHTKNMNIGIEYFQQERDSDLVIGFDSGTDHVQFNNMVALMLDQDYDGHIRWAAPASQGRVVIGATDEGAQATVDGPLYLGGTDKASIVTALNKVFDVSHTAVDANLVFLVDDGGIGHGAALFYFINKNGDDHIDADEVTTLMMFADGAPQQVDIQVIGSESI